MKTLDWLYFIDHWLKWSNLRVMKMVYLAKQSSTRESNGFVRTATDFWETIGKIYSRFTTAEKKNIKNSVNNKIKFHNNINLK